MSTSTFAPFHHPTARQHTFLTRQQKLLHGKRKRGNSSSSASEAATAEPVEPPSSSAYQHPLTRTDPYHIAGWTRSAPLPPPPYPHAATKPPAISKEPLDSALAALNPPLYFAAEDKDSNHSLRRRHLDNLTTILHSSLLRQDYARASRAWSIILRTEIGGREVDIRRHERWGVGAELLMRKGGFADEGFKLAREYYERLVLQYPHTAAAAHTVNATVFYPALFNVWVYEVQRRSRKAREVRDQEGAMDESSESVGEMSDEFRRIQRLELDDALPIAKRLDEILLSPPYDADVTLLELRGMMAFWIADLHTVAALSNDEMDISISSGDVSLPTSISATQHQLQAESEKDKARDIFTRLISLDVPLPPQIVRFAQESNPR